jgi:hypothetical protein
MLTWSDLRAIDSISDSLRGRLGVRRRRGRAADGCGIAPVASA